MNRAFTLIELLVEISVIAVLLPAICMVRDSACQANCGATGAWTVVGGD